MMVGDDEVEAEPLRGFSFGEGAHAGVDCDDEPNALGMGDLKHSGLQAVAFAKAMRDVEANLAAEQFNCGFQQHDGGGSVHVVVAIEQDGFLARDGRFDAFHGGLHAEHQQGIVQMRDFRIEECKGFAGCGDAASDKKFGEDNGDAG